MLGEHLEKKHYFVEIKHSLREAAQRLKSGLPDIVFLDNDLPDGVGWNLGVQILSDFPGVFVVFISALKSVLPNIPEGSRFAVLEKPLNIKTIEAQIDKIAILNLHHWPQASTG